MSFPYPCVWSGSAFQTFPPGTSGGDSVTLTFPAFSLTNDFGLVIAQTLSNPNINTEVVSTVLQVGAQVITTIGSPGNMGAGDGSRSAQARNGYSTGSAIAKALLVTGGFLRFQYTDHGEGVSMLVGAAIFDINLKTKTPGGPQGFSATSGSISTNPLPVSFQPSADPITVFPLIAAALVGNSPTPTVSVAGGNNPPSTWVDVLNASNGNHQICISMYLPNNGGQGLTFNVAGIPVPSGGDVCSFEFVTQTITGISTGRSFAQIVG